MKRLLILNALLLMTIPSSAIHYTPEIEQLLIRLDSEITLKEAYVTQKENRIAQLSLLQNKVTSQEEQYRLNSRFYDEYFVYNADSAMTYVNRNMEIARKQDNQERLTEWRIKKSFLHSATGLLKEAEDELHGITGHTLPRPLQVEYYGQMLYLFSHLGQYTGNNALELRDKYYKQEGAYKDSIDAIIQPEDSFYLWYKGWYFLGTDSTEQVKQALQAEISATHLDTRHEAMNAYILARLSLEDGEWEEYLKYMIYSAIADVRSANKDIASLEELSKALFDLGDIDRAYTYINYCLMNAQLYRNRVRVVGISEMQNDIHKAYLERSRKQEKRVQISLAVVCVLSVVLLIAFLYIYRQMKRLAVSRAKLNEHVSELSKAHVNLAIVNDRLKESNDKLRESNYVKEEYIGYIFALCSNYINKLDEYRKDINRKIRVKQYDEIRTLTDKPTMPQNELKEFYHNFDAIFLHIYPDFINDFNALLQPEERIVPKEGELLNTDLRIYALVRLGINDSVKIAEFLHCSPQTVYNNRLKIRNKAIIPKEEFAHTVHSLGKMRR